MKVLIDNATNTVIGSYLAPIDFSVSGKSVVDVPDNFGVKASTSVVADLLTQKVVAFKAQHPALPQAFSDELFDLTKVDTGLSSRIVAGDRKRTSVLPGGYLMTAPFTITVVSLTLVCVHWSGFTMYSDSGPPTVAKPPPSRLLMDYDPGLPGFVPFDPTTFAVSMMDSTGTIPLIAGPIPLDTEVSYASVTPLTVRLKFLNTGAVPARLSDWIFLA